MAEPGTGVTYSITISSTITNGKVETDKLSAAKDATVTLTVTPNDGYQLRAGTLKANDTEVTLTGRQCGGIDTAAFQVI